MSAPYHHTCDSSPTYCLGAQLLYSADKPGKTVHTYVVSYTTHPLALTHPSTSTQVSGIPSQTRCPHTSPCTQVITYVHTYTYIPNYCTAQMYVYPHTSHSNYQSPHTPFTPTHSHKQSHILSHCSLTPPLPTCIKHFHTHLQLPTQTRLVCCILHVYPKRNKYIYTLHTYA